MKSVGIVLPQSATCVYFSYPTTLKPHTNRPIHRNPSRATLSCSTSLCCVSPRIERFTCIAENKSQAAHHRGTEPKSPAALLQAPLVVPAMSSSRRAWGDVSRIGILSEVIRMIVCQRGHLPFVEKVEQKCPYVSSIFPNDPGMLPNTIINEDGILVALARGSGRSARALVHNRWGPWWQLRVLLGP